jgi:hypothetical protein
MIPRDIQPLRLDLQDSETNSIIGTVEVPAHQDVRIVMRQSAEGRPVRTSGGAPPNGTSMGKLLRIEASQSGNPLEMQIHYDREVWSGLSWAAGEIKSVNLTSGARVLIRGVSSEKRAVELQLEVHSVRY